MDCDDLFKLTIDEVQATGAPSTTSLTRQCPDLCHRVNGTTDFDLAGTAVYLSLLFQVTLFLTFGTLLSFVSSRMWRNADKQTKINFERLRMIWNRAYDTSMFMHFATATTVYFRMRRDGELGVYEYDMMAIQMTLYFFLTGVGVMSYGGLNFRDWNEDYTGPYWPFVRARIISVAAMLVMGRVVDMTPYAPKAAAFFLCSPALQSEEWYRELYTSIYNAVIASYMSISIICVLGMAPLLLMPSFRHASFIWLIGIYHSRIFGIVRALAQVLVGFGLLATQTYELARLRGRMLEDGLLSGTSWDFSQFVVLLLWLPVAYRMVLVLIVCIDDTFIKPKTRPVNTNKAAKSLRVSVELLLLLDVRNEPDPEDIVCDVYPGLCTELAEVAKLSAWLDDLHERAKYLLRLIEVTTDSDANR